MPGLLSLSSMLIIMRHRVPDPVGLRSVLLLRSVAFLLFMTAAILPLNSQTGGDNTYEFLNLSHSAFANSTGGISVASRRSDLTLPYFNPALLDASMDNDISLSFSTWVAGVSYGYASWARNTETAGTFAGGISFVSYGKFTAADETGNITGSFTAAEYCFNLLWSWQIDSAFTVGVNLKPVISNLERYFSAGICADIGAAYHNEKLLLDAGLVIRNAGLQIRGYTDNGGEPLPFEIIAGVTKRLSHAPFSFSLTLRHLEKPDLTHDYDTEDETPAGKIGEDVLRHIVAGVEILPSEAFWIGAGLDYKRRAEMRTQQRTGMAGFTAGFGIRTKAFEVAYAHDTFHPAGGTNHITLTLKPEIIFKKQPPLNKSGGTSL